MAQAQQQSVSPPHPPLLLLAFMMTLGPFADTEYTPSMPAIAQAMQVDYALVQLSMVSYLIGVAVSQLFYGPLSDRFGRRPVMLWGAGIFAAGSVLCLVSFFIWTLIAGRLLQGLGASTGAVIAKAAVRDAYSEDERQRVYSELNVVFALGPALGPVVGSFVHHAIGWHANFGILVGLSVLLLLLVWRNLPETKVRLEPHAIEPARVWRNYQRPLLAPQFMYYSVIGGCAIGVVYVALIGAPDLVINVLGRGTQAIVYVALGILAGFLTGALICALLTNRVAGNAIMLGGLCVLLAGSLSLMGVAIFIGQQGSLVTYLLPVSICFTGVGLVEPVSTAKAMDRFRRIAGTASSLMGFVRMGVAAVGTGAMALLHEGSVYDMPIVFLCLTAVAFVVFFAYIGRPGLRGAKS